MAHEVVVADILEWAKTYDGPKFHALLCDPPYHLTSIVKRFGGRDAAPAQEGSDGRFSRLSRGFMGQEWDGGDIAFRPETWAALSQHLLPGAHLLAFGGTRTWHRLAVAIEDAGFEIRDSLLWLYGSGFPKSHDVSKGLDRAAGAEREVVGVKSYPREGTTPVTRKATSIMAQGGGDNVGQDSNLLTAPATDAARRWDGWGTALKPAWEPIIVARKPLNGTVAANCVEYGCGALNIDGCRIPTNGDDASHRASAWSDHAESKTFHGQQYRDMSDVPVPAGRWPANVLHDGSEEVLAGFPQGRSSGQYNKGAKGIGAKAGPASIAVDGLTSAAYDDSGSASRFFYTAKADTQEREHGLLGAVPCTAYGKPGVIHDPDGEGGLITKRHFVVDESGQPQRDAHGTIVYADCRRNPHPTVKPLDLLRYLSLLILPPPLDVPRRILVPFAGVGSEVIGARQAGWDDVLGVEITKQYADIAAVRLTAFLGML